MQIRSLLTLTTALALTAGVAQAEANYQTVYGIAATYSIEGNDIDMLNIGGEVEQSFGRFTFGLAVDAMRLWVPGDDGDFSMIGATFGYDVTDNLSVVATFDNYQIEGPGDFSDRLLGVEYKFADYTLGLAGAQNSYDGYDHTIPLAFAHVEKGPYSASLLLSLDDDGKELALVASHENDRYEADVGFGYSNDFDYTVASVDATYYFDAPYRANGRLLVGQFENTDVVELGIGGGYKLAENVWADIGYSQIRVEGDKLADGFSLELTFETGDRKLKTRSVMEDAYTAISPTGLLIN